MPNFRQGAPLKSTSSGRGRQIGCAAKAALILARLDEAKEWRLLETDAFA